MGRQMPYGGQEWPYQESSALPCPLTLNLFLYPSQGRDGLPGPPGPPGPKVGDGCCWGPSSRCQPAPLGMDGHILPEVPWVLVLTVMCPQVDMVEGSLMGLPGERGPIGPKGSKVCGCSERRRAAETTKLGKHHELGLRIVVGQRGSKG